MIKIQQDLEADLVTLSIAINLQLTQKQRAVFSFFDGNLVNLDPKDPCPVITRNYFAFQLQRFAQRI